ncbi:hypothetical protein Hanom_Chr11g01003161 [Helianthus anomalus]
MFDSHSSHYFLQHPGGGRLRWCRFVLEGRRGFTDYYTVVPLGGWRPGFRASGERQGADGGRVVDLGHSTRYHGGCHVFPLKKLKLASESYLKIN